MRGGGRQTCIGEAVGAEVENVGVVEGAVGIVGVLDLAESVLVRAGPARAAVPAQAPPSTSNSKLI